MLRCAYVCVLCELEAVFSVSRDCLIQMRLKNRPQRYYCSPQMFSASVSHPEAAPGVCVCVWFCLGMVVEDHV